MNISNQKPFSGAQFQLLLNPAQARVYIEVHDSLKDKVSPEDLLWNDHRVLSAFCNLLGVSQQYLERVTHYPRSIEEQLAITFRAKEMLNALWQADEKAQLDGQPALDFAHGWILSREWLKNIAICPNGQGCSRMKCPPITKARSAAIEATKSAFPSNEANFVQGFIAGIEDQIIPESGHGCSLSQPEGTFSKA